MQESKTQTQTGPPAQPLTKEEKMVKEFKKKYIEDQNPFQSAGIFSRMFYGWVRPLLKVSTTSLRLPNLLKPSIFPFSIFFYYISQDLDL